jgi:hypothetical protein
VPLDPEIPQGEDQIGSELLLNVGTPRLIEAGAAETALVPWRRLVVKLSAIVIDSVACRRNPIHSGIYDYRSV